MNDNKEDFEKSTLSADGLTNIDVKINPEFYIHHCLVKAQYSLVKEDVKAGFMQFRMIVEHLEVLCRSAKKISKNYDEDLKTYLNDENYKSASDEIKSVLLANKKIELLTAQIFKQRTITTHLKDQ